jgi:hypothetical protein
VHARVLADQGWRGQHVIVQEEQAPTPGRAPTIIAGHGDAALSLMYHPHIRRARRTVRILYRV